MTTEELKIPLEMWMDKHSASAAIELIAEICSDKASHIREVRQDPYTAKPWELLATRINKLAAVAAKALP